MLPPSSRRQLAASALLHRAVHVRPMADVLWTTPNQSDPRWRRGEVCRPNVVYDALSAVLRPTLPPSLALSSPPASSSAARSASNLC